MGRVISQRRTKSEWELLIAMHRGYYPLSDFQAFRRTGPPQTEPGPDGRPPDNRHPMDKVIPHLAEKFPLKTPEWSEWAPNMRAPKLVGRWAFFGYQTGKGSFYGVTTIKPTDKDDEFTTETRYVRAKTGDVVARQGKAVVYTGFQWRGRSFAGSSDQAGMREVMFVERNQRELSGRWFTGAYDETGIEVTLRRIGNDPIVLGLDSIALQTGANARSTNPRNEFPGGRLHPLPSTSGPASLSSAWSAQRGPREGGSGGRQDAAALGRATYGWRECIGEAAPPCVYDKIDGIKVRPRPGWRAWAGLSSPSSMQQFEAIAFNNGADGKPDTKDDLDLGPIDVAWSIEEFTATFDDDDKQYVGKLDDKGLFTPNVDGPNPKRRNHADNYGDVWVIATYKLPDGKTLRARGHLLVTVPALHPIRSARGGPMSELALREFHSFQAAGKDFVYLVPSAAVFELDEPPRR